MIGSSPFPESPLPKDLKPAVRYVAEAIPTSGGKFYARFAPPGLVPRIVEDAFSRKPAEFETAREATAEARRVLFEALNSAPRETSKSKLAAYAKLSGPEFAVLLAEVDISPTFLAFIMATNYQRVLDWISGAQDVPHTARVLLEIFKHNPEALDIAEAVTRASASERMRRPARDALPE